MLCAVCQQKEATVHFTEIGEDKITKLHLCSDCARKKGLGEKDYPAISDLLTSLAGAKTISEQEGKPCPGCGLSFADFRREGRLGCGQCYNFFFPSLGPLIGSIHHQTKHAGKVPAAHREAAPALDLKSLKTALAEAVDKENFELAARLRDQIRELEKKDSAPRKTQKKNSASAPEGVPDGD